MPHSVCIKCSRKLRPVSNGAYLVTMFQSPPEPYEIYSCDIWQCRECGHEVVIGIGSKPLYQHWHSDFERQYAAILAKRDAGLVRVVYQLD